MASAIGDFCILHSFPTRFLYIFLRSMNVKTLDIARIEWTAPTYVHADDMPPGGETVIYPVRKPPKQ